MSFRETLREFTRAILADLNEQPLPVLRRTSVSVRLDGVGSVEEVLAPDWNIISFRATSLHGTAVFEAFLRAATDDQLLADAVPLLRDAETEMQALVVHTQVVEPFVRYYLEHFGSEFSDARFDAVYVALQRYLVSTERRVEWVAPLHGVTGEFDECRLSDAVHLSRLSHGEIENLAGRAHMGEFGLLDPVETARYVGLTHAVRITEKVPRDALLGTQFAIEDVRDAVSVLRLAGVAVNALPAVPIAVDTDDFGVRYHDLAWSFRGPEEQPVEHPHALGDQELKRLARDCAALREAKEDKRYALALRRFNTALLRADAADQIVDSAVGLEALFSPSSNQELKFRISARVAVFLEEPGQSRLRVFENAKQVYDARSAVAHGSTNSETKAAHAAPKGKELLRRVLQRWLEADVERDGDALDQAMLQGLNAHRRTTSDAMDGY